MWLNTHTGECANPRQTTLCYTINPTQAETNTCTNEEISEKNRNLTSQFMTASLTYEIEDSIAIDAEDVVANNFNTTRLCMYVDGCYVSWKFLPALIRSIILNHI